MPSFNQTFNITPDIPSNNVIKHIPAMHYGRSGRAVFSFHVPMMTPAIPPTIPIEISVCPRQIYSSPQYITPKIINKIKFLKIFFLMMTPPYFVRSQM